MNDEENMHYYNLAKTKVGPSSGPSHRPDDDYIPPPDDSDEPRPPPNDPQVSVAMETQDG